MRLGGPVFEQHDSPEAWAAQVDACGYRAAYCPVSVDADEATVQAYARAAGRVDIVIAEVGVWNSPLSGDADQRREAIDKCIASLDLADRIGARCCVNVSGSRGERWAGLDPRNLTDETFDMIVEVVRHIIDAASPTRTFYTVETMPWMYPDTVDNYVRLVDAIDRPAAAVHMDPVNLVSSPQRYYDTPGLIREFFAKLGARVKSCHAKDILLLDQLTTHLDEVRPGLGGLDYGVYLRELDRLDDDIPLMLEHLPNAAEYSAAADYIRCVALREGLEL